MSGLAASAFPRSACWNRCYADRVLGSITEMAGREQGPRTRPARAGRYEVQRVRSGRVMPPPLGLEEGVDRTGDEQASGATVRKKRSLRKILVALQDVC